MPKEPVPIDEVLFELSDKKSEIVKSAIDFGKYSGYTKRINSCPNCGKEFDKFLSCSSHYYTSSCSDEHDGILKKFGTVERPKIPPIKLENKAVCAARNNKSGYCSNPAGFKTSHVGTGRCNFHGGAGSGAPKNNKNAEKHGKYSGENFYYGNKWNKIREEIRERDGNTCQYKDCNKTPKEDSSNKKNLDVHHIVPVAHFENKENAHTYENLVQLCKEHHALLEGKNKEKQISMLSSEPERPAQK